MPSIHLLDARFRIRSLHASQHFAEHTEYAGKHAKLTGGESDSASVLPSSALYCPVSLPCILRVKGANMQARVFRAGSPYPPSRYIIKSSSVGMETCPTEFVGTAPAKHPFMHAFFACRIPLAGEGSHIYKIIR